MRIQEQKWTSNIRELFRADKLLNIIPIIPAEIPTGMCVSANTVNTITRFLLWWMLLSFALKDRGTFVKDARVALVMILGIAVFSEIADRQFCTTHPAAPPPKAPARIAAQAPPIGGGYTMQTNQVLRDQYNATLNNPFGNPNPYTTCANHVDHSLLASNGIKGISQRGPAPPHAFSEANALGVEMLLGEYGGGELNDMTITNPTIEVLKNNQNKMLQRSFYKVPVTDCVNDLDKFAKSLYGDPSKPIFKQQGLARFAEG